MTTNNCFVNSSNLLTESDWKEQADIERWRYLEKIRQEKLNNSKHRLSTAHQSTLAQQIYDKMVHNDNEEKLSEAYARDGAKHKAIIQLLELRQEEDRRNLAQEINDFRMTYQQSKDAREYDLNDTSIPINEANHLEYGPGSCLYFEGEDSNRKDREKEQKEQMKQWINEQRCEKAEAIQEQQMLDEIYDCNQLMIAKRIKKLEARQMMFRHQLENDVKEFNKAFAQQKQCQRKIKEAYELEDKKQEIQNMLIHNIYTEHQAPRASYYRSPMACTDMLNGDYQIGQKIKTKIE